MTNKKVSESRFQMWRTLFAIAHADHIVTEEEQKFMEEALESVPFSLSQKTILEEDIKHPKDIIEMFEGISDFEDRSAFFDFARKLVWIDGDYGEEEQDIILKLKTAHMKTADAGKLIGHVMMELEEDIRPVVSREAEDLVQDSKASRAVKFFMRRFGY